MTTEGYRNKPQFQYNETLNKNVTPNVPEFNSNAMNNSGMMSLNNCANCNCDGHDHKHEHKEHGDHECCHGKHAEGHEHKHCGCNCDNK
ncbi:MAG: hypothetical protein RSG52_01530 [Terrisporobacter sp.]|uniref:hypothetical protein n=1 Tax=Terrisporobacter sp. TaxID=1965305 RepID=UPI002FC91767